MKIAHETLTQFIYDLLCAAGVEAQEAEIMAPIFVWCDLVGRPMQGVGRLPAYLKRFKHGLIQSPARPEMIPKTDTLWLINGHDGFGQYLGHIAMQKAIELAEQYGMGLVGVRQSNHFGAGAYYVHLAAQSLKLGLAFSNSYPIVAPYGGITAALGTNPFAFGAPTRQGESILVDFSTGAKAGSTVRKAIEEKQAIPEDVLIDKAGNSITDPNQAQQGVMLPFGGPKGFCLGLMIEILSGVITGAAISHQIASLYKNFEQTANIGHFFWVLDIAKMMPLEIYFERLETLIQFIKAVEPEEAVPEILIPGQTRWRHYHKQIAEGIELEEETWELLLSLAQDLGLEGE